jgi:hypothetical protein
LHGFFYSLDIIKAEVHDIQFLKNITQQMSDCEFLGDIGYFSQSIHKRQILNFKHLKELIKKIISHNLISLENQEKELKHYFLNYSTSSELETIMLKFFKVLNKNFNKNTSIYNGSICQ